MTETQSVLIVEDNDDHAYLIEEALCSSKNFKFNPIRVCQLGEAIQMVSNQHFYAVILDLNLPDSRGNETVHRMVKEATTTPLIIATSLEDEETAVSALKLGVQDYIVKKHITSDTVTRAIRYAASRKELDLTLKKKIEELEDFNKLAIGREMRIIELKRQVNEILQSQGAELRYDLSFVSKVNYS